LPQFISIDSSIDQARHKYPIQTNFTMVHSIISPSLPPLPDFAPPLPPAWHDETVHIEPHFTEYRFVEMYGFEESLEEGLKFLVFAPSTPENFHRDAEMFAQRSQEIVARNDDVVIMQLPKRRKKSRREKSIERLEQRLQKQVKKSTRRHLQFLLKTLKKREAAGLQN
jgi:hypothetical protein